MSHALDTWCYDDCRPHVWVGEWTSAISLQRSLKLVWTVFDHNPAFHVTRILAEQPIEEFLVHGPALPIQPTTLFDDINAYLRLHRTPGSTTLVMVDITAETGVITGVHLTINDQAADGLAAEVPGDKAAGSISEIVEEPKQRTWRMCVAPGTVQLRGDVYVRRDTTLERVPIAQDLEIAQGEQRLVELRFA